MRTITAAASAASTVSAAAAVPALRRRVHLAARRSISTRARLAIVPSRRLLAPLTSTSTQAVHYQRLSPSPNRTYATATADSVVASSSSPSSSTSTSAPTHDGSFDISEDARSNPMNEYRRLIDRGALRPDDHQVRIVQKLHDLHAALARGVPAAPKPPRSNGLLSRLFGDGGSDGGGSDADAPRGLYLYGDVGTGKTMLMDLFYKTLPPAVHRKRRVHFHAFMIDVHKRIHATKARMGAGSGGGGDPIAPVARELAREASVLCFDEFQVTDIADAMILRRLLEVLREEGVVMVITSNRHPDELYKNGIQRSSFVPAIELLKSAFDVTDLDSGTDYRRIPRSLSNVYYHPLDDGTRTEIDKVFGGLSAGQEAIEGREIDIWGRTLRVPISAGRVARFEFDDLCGAPLSAADYIELTKHFGTIFVCEVRKMGLGEKDRARRFITFVDACYESKTKLIVSSEVPIYLIFAGDGSPSSTAGISDHMRSVMDDLGLPADVVGASSMFSGEEEVFAFARCCSRLVQMGSVEWAETAGMS